MLPHDVSITDFNHDDHEDLVIPNRDGDDVAVYLGNGNGTFQAGVTYSTGRRALRVSLPVTSTATTTQTSPRAAATITSSTCSSETGAAGSKPAFPYDVGDEPYSLAVGDFDEDDNEDLAVAAREVESVSIMLRQGRRDVPRDAALRHVRRTRMVWSSRTARHRRSPRRGRRVHEHLGGAGVPRAGNGTFSEFGSYPVGSFPRT